MNPILWCDKTISPITGCSPCSPGCDNCYARRMANRLRGRCGYPADAPFQVTFHPERLEQLISLKKPCRVFLNSMGDWFHPDVPDGWVDQCLAALALSPNITGLVLTKRPDRMREYFAYRSNDGFFDREDRISHAAHRMQDSDRGALAHIKKWPIPNLHLGLTVCNQAEADEKIPAFLQTPAAVHFLSIEPLLGPIDLEKPYPCSEKYLFDIDGLIVGGESGPGARPMLASWVRDIRNQCRAASVAFFFKQWGEWAPSEFVSEDMAENLKAKYDESTDSWCVGKRRAGRLLDGREHNDLPGKEIAQGLK